ncbi:hypothetical protein KIN20_012610 [Parelaphostrongylus tenuis]|uniref:Uncharacterized protein n=1 Tax=Parelaphostrongylus tenuis TaxID=148309 RepID=A0AAD5N188_PARTN|nr:hypothetical protein KIN20_012610 [Parelaphostrongylus tenuis]
MNRLFPSLVLLLYTTPCYLLSTTPDYERRQRQVQQNSAKSALKIFSTPLFSLDSDYRNRYRLADSYDDNTRPVRKMRQSFGVSSKYSRWSPHDNTSNQPLPPAKPPLYHFNTARQVFVWTEPPPPGIATTMLPPLRNYNIAGVHFMNKKMKEKRHSETRKMIRSIAGVRLLKVLFTNRKIFTMKPLLNRQNRRQLFKKSQQKFAVAKIMGCNKLAVSVMA